MLRAAPAWARYVLGAVALVGGLLLVNWIYQVGRKPTEVFFLAGTLSRTPAQTWREYAPIFERNATATSTPELLAALAQVEGAGNPLARTYWRWRFTHEPFEIYRPASSAVGMYQITDGTFREAKRYCVRNHAVLEDGPWHAWESCWFNRLYFRVVPSHAVEMTAALLDRQVAAIAPRATQRQKEDLAAVAHLCGASAGAAYAARGFRVGAGQRCGDEDLRAYLARVNAMKREFARLRGLS
ncbi:MAG TPA: transglycosylase SLT domain-containing protein [Burkholderiales bacterium]